MFPGDEAGSEIGELSYLNLSCLCISSHRYTQFCLQGERNFRCIGFAWQPSFSTTTIFSGFCSGTRNVLAAYLVTFVVSYILSSPALTLRRLIAVCGTTGIVFLFASYYMLEFRNVGLKRYMERGSGIESRETLFIDYNLLAISRLTEVFPDRYGYLGMEVPIWAIVRPIPRALWSGKPEGLSVGIEEALGEEGLTISTTYAGESYMAGGFLGVVVASLFFSGLASWWNRFSRSFSLVGRIGSLCFRFLLPGYLDAEPAYVFDCGPSDSSPLCFVPSLVTQLLCGRRTSPTEATKTSLKSSALHVRIRVLSVAPSPYQRDLFHALNRCEGITVQVSYLEEDTPDSPWPKANLADFESVLPGVTAGHGRVRCHTNWGLPNLEETDVLVVNAALTGITSQRVMRQCTRMGIPWVFWGELLRERMGIHGFLQRTLAAPLNRASAIIAIGSEAKSDYQRRFPVTPIFELPYYCSINKFRTHPQSRRSNEVRLLFCGQMIERKGFDLLLDAYTKIHDRIPHLRLTLAGRETPFSRSLLGALPSPIRRTIDNIGFQIPDRLPKVFASSDIFVLPSRHDGWGVVINQALAAGLPIVATDAVGAARDLVSDSVNGFIVPANESHPLSKVLLKLASDTALRTSMSARSRDLSHQLQPTFGAKRFVEILRQALDRPSRQVACAS